MNSKDTNGVLGQDDALLSNFIPLTPDLVSLVLDFPFQFAESHAKVKIERNYLNKQGYFVIWFAFFEIWFGG